MPRKKTLPVPAVDEPLLNVALLMADGTSLPLFSGLPIDLLALACGHLETRDLLALRHVSKHWAAASRLPRSWIASHWEVGTRIDDDDDDVREKIDQMHIGFGQISRGMPHLRSIGIFFSHEDDDQRIRYKPLLVLQRLERVVACAPCIPRDLLPNLSCLRQVDLVTPEPRNEAWFRLSEVDLSCLDSLNIEQLGIDGATCEKLVLDLKDSPLLSRLRVFDTSGMRHGLYLTAEVMAMFTLLEELDIDSLAKAIRNTEGFQSFAHAPALRILSVSAQLADCHDFPSMKVASLLSTPSFNARLEYLRLRCGRLDRDVLRTIVTECTSLLGLELDQRHRCGPLADDIVCNNLAAITEEQWHDSAQRTEKDEPTLLTLLAAPTTFRRRLLSLRLNVNSVETLVQLRRRYPNLASLRYDVRSFVDGEEEAMHESVDIFQWPWTPEPGAFPWLAQETLSDDATVTSVHERDGPLSRADAQLALQRPRFHWLRALKRQRGLPLTPSEVAAASQPTFYRA